MDRPADPVIRPAGVVLGLVVTGACLVAALFGAVLLYLRAGGPIVGGGATPPMPWWFVPATLLVWAGALAAAASTFVFGARMRWGTAVVLVVASSTAWVFVFMSWTIVGS